MPASPSLLRRLVPKRSWLDSHGLGLIAGMVISGLFVVALLVAVMLLVDLLVINGSEAQSALQRGQQLEIVPQYVQLDAEGANVDGGLWVQVVRFQGHGAWAWLAPACRAIPLLGTRQGALPTLIVAILLLIIGFQSLRTQARVQAARSARHSATWLRSLIHRQTLRLGPSDLSGQRHQLALRLFVDDSEAVRESLAQWRWRYVRALVFLPVLIISLLALDWKLALECLVPAIACWYVYRYERKKGIAKRRVAEAHAETEVRFLSEALKQTRLVRGYNMEDFEQSLFNQHLGRLTAQTSQGRRLERAALSTARFVTWAGVALIFLLISLRVQSAGAAALPLCGAVTMLIALGLFAIELNSCQRLWQARTEMLAGAERIYRYVDEIPEVGQAVGAKFIEPVSKAIVFEAVHYQQQGHELLRGLDLRIEARSQVALVSLDPLVTKAVAYMLPRFIEPSKGRLLFDGEDIAWGTLESIRTEAVYVGGDDPVLSGSILENIICGDTRYSLQEATEAAKLVHAHKFISRLPQGYETIVGELGESLSAGDAFRLGLARAALRDPAVLIIEEPRVVFDEDTKALVDDAYHRLCAKRTVVFLPSRLSTIRRCEQVIMLHEGRVEGIGSHSELSKVSALYRHWDYVTFNVFSRDSRPAVGSGVSAQVPTS